MKKCAVRACALVGALLSAACGGPQGPAVQGTPSVAGATATATTTTTTTATTTAIATTAPPPSGVISGQIAYAARDGQGESVWLLALGSGTPPQRLTHADPASPMRADQFPAFADKGIVAFVRDAKQLHTIKVDGSGDALLATCQRACSLPTSTPMLSQVAYIDDDGTHTRIMMLDSPAPRPWDAGKSLKRGCRVSRFASSVDRQTMLTVVDGGLPCNAAQAVFYVTPAGAAAMGDPIVLDNGTPKLANIRAIATTAASARIFVTAFEAGEAMPGVYSMMPDGSDIKRIATGNGPSDFADLALNGDGHYAIGNLTSAASGGFNVVAIDVTSPSPTPIALDASGYKAIEGIDWAPSP